MLPVTQARYGRYGAEWPHADGAFDSTLQRLARRRIGPSLRAREAGPVPPARSHPPSRGELGIVPDRPAPLGSAAGEAPRGSSREGYDGSGSTNDTRSGTI